MPGPSDIGTTVDTEKNFPSLLLLLKLRFLQFADVSKFLLTFEIVRVKYVGHFNIITFQHSLELQYFSQKYILFYSFALGNKLTLPGRGHYFIMIIILL